MSKSTKVCENCNAHIKGLNCEVTITKCPNCGKKLE